MGIVQYMYVLFGAFGMLCGWIVVKAIES